MAQPVAGVGTGGLDGGDTISNFHSPGGISGQSLFGAQVVLGGGSGIEVAAYVEGPGAFGQTVFQSDNLGILAVGDGNAILGLGDLSLGTVVTALIGAQGQIGTGSHNDNLIAGLQSGNIGNQSGGVAGGLRGFAGLRRIGGFTGSHLGHIGSGVHPQLIAIEIADHGDHIHGIPGSDAFQSRNLKDVDGSLALGQGSIAGSCDFTHNSALDQNPGALQSAHILVGQQLGNGNFLQRQLGSTGLGELRHSGELLQTVVCAPLAGGPDHIAHSDVSGSGIEVQVDTAA